MTDKPQPPEPDNPQPEDDDNPLQPTLDPKAPPQIAKPDPFVQGG